MKILKPIVLALTETIIKPKGINESQVLRLTAEKMLERLKIMPRFLAAPMAVLTIIFDLSGFFRNAKRFQSQSVEQREALIEAWRHSPVGLCRNLVAFYEKMIVFIYYSIRETP